MRYCVFLNITGKGGKMATTVLVWRAENPVIFTRSEAKKNVQKTLFIGSDYGSIGEEAFRGNIKLRHLSLEKNIKEIQREAFLNCTNMKQIEMPGVQVIRQKAFAGCAKLEKAEFVKPIRRMEKNVFAGCKRLMTMKMNQESRQSRIEEGTFRECQSLQEVQVPSSFTEIGKFAFYKCIDLSQFSFSGDLKKIGAFAFYQCGISELSLPESLEVIEDSAFLKCKKLEYVRIPANVKIIEKWAFHGCNQLKVLEIPGDPEIIGEWIANKSTHIHCKKGSKVDKYCRENGYVTEYL